VSRRQEEKSRKGVPPAWDAGAVQVDLGKGTSNVNTSAAQTFKVGGSFFGGFELSFDLGRYEQMASACKQ
jgi:hypothetical protein